MKSLPLAVAAVVFLLLVFSQSSGMVRADLVDDACAKTDFAVICTSTLRADPGSASADVKGLARIMLQVVETNTNETYAQVESLLGQASDPVLKDMLTNCGYEYGGSVVGSCPDAIRKFDMGFFRIAQGNMEDVAGSAESCEQFFSCEAAFTDGHIDSAETFVRCQPRPSPLTDWNHRAYALARIAQDIIATIN